MAAKIYDTEGFTKVYFTNPKTSERIEKVFKAENKKDALAFANELDFNFYSENKSFLPYGISIENHNKRFRLFVRLTRENKKDYPKMIFSSKLLYEVIEARESVIKTLTGIK